MTKAQRHKDYKKALGFLKKTPDDNPTGLCIVIGKAMGQRLKSAYIDVPNLYPELLKRKPKREIGVFESWWTDDAKGKLERIKVLKQCIKLTAPKPLPHAKR